MKNTETLARLREIKERIEALESRLESPEGCEAADCSAEREADKEQADAERAKPSSAALIPPGQAEAIYSKAIQLCDAGAANYKFWAEYYKDAGRLDFEELNNCQAASYEATRDYYEWKLAESRIANGAEALEHEHLATCLVRNAHKYFKKELSGRRNVKINRCRSTKETAIVYLKPPLRHRL